MPLILAIEPDRQQAARVAALAPAHIQAEIVVVDSVSAALRALEARVPDLVLTPLLLSAKDDGALTKRLRQVATGGVELQTLVTPVLASTDAAPATTERSSGLFNRIRKSKTAAASPDGCQPAVFAQQINEYLGRLASERHDREESARVDQWASPHVTASAPLLAELLPMRGEAYATAVGQDVDPSQWNGSVEPESGAPPDAPTEHEDALAVAHAPQPLPQLVTVEEAAAPVSRRRRAATATQRVEVYHPIRHEHTAIEPLPAATGSQLEAVETTLDSESAPTQSAPLVTEPVQNEPARAAPVLMSAVQTIEPVVESAEPVSHATELSTEEFVHTNEVSEDPELIDVAPMPLAHGETVERVSAPEDERAGSPSADPEIQVSTDEATEVPSDDGDTVSEWDDLETFLDLEVGDTLPAVDTMNAADEPEPVPIDLPSTDEAWAPLTGPTQQMAPIEGPELKRRRPAKPAKTPKAPRSSRSQSGGAARPARKKTTDTKPMQDEWGLYDPEQCGFAALLNRLEELTAQAEAERPNRAKRSAIMRR